MTEDEDPDADQYQAEDEDCTVMLRYVRKSNFRPHPDETWMMDNR